MKIDLLVCALAMVLIGTNLRGEAAAEPIAVIRAQGRGTIVVYMAAPAPVALRAFTPTAEARWSPRWRPQFSDPSHPDREGSVFTTQAASGENIWLFDRYDRIGHEIHYVEVTPGHSVTQIGIQVTAIDTRRSIATITYRRTSLSAQGDADVRHFLTHFASQQAHWEHVLNDFVKSESH